MWLLPYETLTIRTYLTPDEVVDELDEVVGPQPPFEFLVESDKPYFGKVTDNCFKVRRVTSLFYRNMFRPVIIGKIQPDINGSIVHIKMRLSIPAIVVALFFANIIFGATGIMDFLMKAQPLSLEIVWPMILIFFGIVIGGFKFEALLSRSFFRELFEKQNSFDKIDYEFE